jgi:uncharacterized membrane protein
VITMARTESKADNPVTERLKTEARSLVSALGDRAVSSLGNKVNGTAGRLTKYVEGGAGPGLVAAVTGAKGLAEGKSPFRAMLGAGVAGVKEKVAGMFRGKGGGQKKLKITSIIESVDVGVPVKLAYNQWTQFSDFPKFMKKVENVDQPDEQKTTWKAQVFWSHRTWESTVVEQVPDDRIVWRSKGAKGYVDGSVTFHELAPNLTRILLVLEYHPQGLFERTGNIWRAQGRRARLELKHFRRHVMTEAVLHADDIEGWRGTIQDGEVVESHEDALAREERGDTRRDGSGQGNRRQGGSREGGSREGGSREGNGREGNGREGNGREGNGRRGRGTAGRRSEGAAGEGAARESAARGGAVREGAGEGAAGEDETNGDRANGERRRRAASRSGSTSRGRSSGGRQGTRTGSTAQQGGSK